MNNIQDLKKLRDPKFYLETFCKIKNKDGGLIPFKLNEAQKDLFNTLNSGVKKLIILKARQLGFSTAVAGYFYHYAIMNPGVTAGLIGYNSDLVSEILDKIKTFIRTTPKEFRPTIQYNSKYEISFPKMDSKIAILPSSENVGSGYTFNLCLITELSKWEKAEQKMTSLGPAVPKNAIEIIETTPAGAGNLFHKMVVKAERGESKYMLKRYLWWWEYSKEDMDEVRKDRGDAYFMQEYNGSFLSSGRPVFDPMMSQKLYKTVLNVGDKNGDFTVYEEDGVRYYAKPKENGVYVLGGDVAEGVTGGDYSVATVWDRETGEEVAMYRGHIPPDRFADKLNVLGRKYNNALMVVEVNNHGLTTLTCLKQLLYPTIYFRQQKFESIGTAMSDKMGWKTNKLTRPLMIDELNQSLREGSMIPRSKELVDELIVFVYDDNGNMNAQPGFHDDSIFSSAMAQQGFKVMFSGELSQINVDNHLPSNFAY